MSDEIFCGLAGRLCSGKDPDWFPANAPGGQAEPVRGPPQRVVVSLILSERRVLSAYAQLCLLLPCRALRSFAALLAMGHRGRFVETMRDISVTAQGSALRPGHYPTLETAPVSGSCGGSDLHIAGRILPMPLLVKRRAFGAARKKLSRNPGLVETPR